jgi:hypothetical protein
MWNSALLLAALAWASQSPPRPTASSDTVASAASTPYVSCFGGEAPATARAATCEQMAAALRLPPASRQQASEAMAAASGGVGKGALVGGALGLGIGLVAALVFGPSCEEGHAGCTAGIIVGSTAAFAIIGAISGAGGDGDRKEKDQQ